MGVVLLAAGLVLYNTIANRWRPFGGWAYVPMNLAATAVVVWVGVGLFGLDAREIGFGSGWPSDLLVGGAMGAALAAPLFALAALPRTRRYVADERARGLRGGVLVYRLAIRVPIGTALFEEIAFRGVLYAAWRPHGAVLAAVATAIPFGLWHVSPTINLIEANKLGAGRASAARTVVGAVALTTAVGIGFAALREIAGTIGGSLGVHAALNSLATLAAVVAGRSSSDRIGG